MNALFVDEVTALRCAAERMASAVTQLSFSNSMSSLIPRARR
jgi:hypothetical protein